MLSFGGLTNTTFSNSTPAPPAPLSGADQLLLRAVLQSDLAQVQAIVLELGGDVLCATAVGDTVLHVACEQQQHRGSGTGGGSGGGPTIEMIELLLGLGADPNARRRQACGWQTPLHIAATRGLLPIAQCLLDRGADANLPDHMGRLPVHWAAHHGDLLMVRLLVLGGCCNYRVCDALGNTPRALAAQRMKGGHNSGGSHAAVVAFLDNPHLMVSVPPPTMTSSSTSGAAAGAAGGGDDYYHHLHGVGGSHGNPPAPYPYYDPAAIAAASAVDGAGIGGPSITYLQPVNGLDDDIVPKAVTSAAEVSIAWRETAGLPARLK